MMDEVIEQKSSWPTLFKNPTLYFSTRRPKLGFVWLAVALSVVSALMQAVVYPYILRSPIYVQLFSKMSHQEILAAKTIFPISAIVGGVITPWISLVLLGFFYWIMTKVFGYSITYRNAMALGTYVALFQLIGTVFSTLATVITGTYIASLLSLSTIIPSSGSLASVLSRISIFDIWSVVIVVIGLSVFTGASKNKTMWIGVLVWIISMFI